MKIYLPVGLKKASGKKHKTILNSHLGKGVEITVEDALQEAPFTAHQLYPHISSPCFSAMFHPLPP